MRCGGDGLRPGFLTFELAVLIVTARLLTIILGAGFHAENGFARFHEIELIAA
jgi:hypothetical protein